MHFQLMMISTWEIILKYDLQNKVEMHLYITKNWHLPTLQFYFTLFIFSVYLDIMPDQFMKPDYFI